MSFEITALRNSNIAYLYRMRHQIRLDPPYQRQGAVWSREKKRLLIDSFLNGFDVPKIYFHEHTRPIEVDGKTFRFSLIDGRQRLEAVWDFLDGKFALAEDFVLFETGDGSAAGKTYSELEEAGDEIAPLLTSIHVDVSVLRTEDLELLEEMFSRLNEAVPLNAAEKRNGRGGALRPVVKDLAGHNFFVQKLPFENRRYRHYDLALKFIYWMDNGGPADSKKRQLDDYWDEHRDQQTAVKQLASDVSTVLDEMFSVFEDDDRLLTSVGMISVFFLCYMSRRAAGEQQPSRANLLRFERLRRLDEFEDETALGSFEKDLLEFDRLSQSPNDESALTFRTKVLNAYLDRALSE